MNGGDISKNPQNGKTGDREYISAAIDKVIDEYIRRFTANTSRIIELVSLWSSIKTDVAYAQSNAVDDILRAAVVLTHATLEEFLRTLALKLYPEADGIMLKGIPLMSLGNYRGRAEKYHLGDLAAFKNMTVKELLRNSVKQYLEHSSFNSVEDIDYLLINLGIDTAIVKRSYEELSELIQRRHLIVHRSDKVELLGFQDNALGSITGDMVSGWVQTVAQFIGDTLKDSTAKHLIIDGYVQVKDGLVTAVNPNRTAS